VPQVVNRHPRRATTHPARPARPGEDAILRALTSLLDEALPVVPAAKSTTTRSRRSAPPAAGRVAAEGDDLPVAWLGRDAPLRRESWRRPT
jgi:magnesium chelatase subunit I